MIRGEPPRRPLCLKVGYRDRSPGWDYLERDATTQGSHAGQPRTHEVDVGQTIHKLVRRFVLPSEPQSQRAGRAEPERERTDPQYGLSNCKGFLPERVFPGLRAGSRSSNTPLRPGPNSTWKESRGGLSDILTPGLTAGQGARPGWCAPGNGGRVGAK